MILFSVFFFKSVRKYSSIVSVYMLYPSINLVFFAIVNYFYGQISHTFTFLYDFRFFNEKSEKKLKL